MAGKLTLKDWQQTVKVLQKKRWSSTILYLHRPISTFAHKNGEYEKAWAYNSFNYPWTWVQVRKGQRWWPSYSYSRRCTSATVSINGCQLIPADSVNRNRKEYSIINLNQLRHLNSISAGFVISSEILVLKWIFF